MKHTPSITLALGLVSGLLMLLPATLQSRLYFDLAQLTQGNILGLISGHWLHADLQHLLWNVAAFTVLGTIIERRSRALLLSSLACGTLAVDILLLSPLGDIQRYCGLSGVLNTLLGVALYLYWRETRSALVILMGILSALKIVIELGYGQSIFTDISWPPYPLAHLAGLVVAPVAFGFFYLGKIAGGQRASFDTRNRHGHLVSS